MNIFFINHETIEPEIIKIYKQVSEHLTEKGHTVFEMNISNVPLPRNTILSQKKEFDTYLKASDFVLAEMSYPSSVNVGYEVAHAIHLGNKCVILYQDDKEPLSASRIDSHRLVISAYNESNLEEILDWALDEVNSLMSRRFSFFISHQLETKLGEKAKKTNISKAEYIRRLITEDVEKS